MLLHRGRGARALFALAFCLSGLALCAAGGCARSEAPAPPVEPAAPAAPAARPSAASEPITPPQRPASEQAPEPEAAQAGPKRKPPGRRVREIRPQQGREGCLEMYGSCTSGPDRVCTSEAYYLDCGERGQLPVTGEPLRCVCP